MTDDLGAEIDRLTDESDGLPSGPARIALLEEAIRLADTRNDEELAFRTRSKIIWPAYQADAADVLLVHYSWCLGFADRHPNRDWFDLLWQYRIVLDSMPSFAAIPRAQIEATMADMARRYSENGFSLRGFHFLQANAYRAVGDEPSARAALKAGIKSSRDVMSDDAVAEQAFKVYYLVFAGHYTKAIEVARPFLTGRFREPYHRVGALSDALVSLARVGRVDEARHLQKTLYKEMRGLPLSGGRAHDHLEFLCVTGDLGRAVKVFERNAGVYTTRRSPERFAFYRAARLLCDRLAAGGHDGHTFRLPDGLVQDTDPAACPAPVFRAWADGYLADFAAAFDARNGNDYHARQLLKLAELNELSDRIAATGGDS